MSLQQAAVFSAHAEVVPFRQIVSHCNLGILRVRGGSSHHPRAGASHQMEIRNPAGDQTCICGDPSNSFNAQD